MKPPGPIHRHFYQEHPVEGFFEHRVLLQFLIDKSLKLHQGGLQKRQRLLKLRRQHLLQRHFLR